MRTVTAIAAPDTVLYAADALLDVNSLYAGTADTGPEFWPGCDAGHPWHPGQGLDITAAIAKVRGYSMDPDTILEDVAGIPDRGDYVRAQADPAFLVLLDCLPGISDPYDLWAWQLVRALHGWEWEVRKIVRRAADQYRVDQQRRRAS